MKRLASVLLVLLMLLSLVACGKKSMKEQLGGARGTRAMAAALR